MKFVDKNITVAELAEMAKKMFGGLVKAVVDIEKEVMVVDADLHADQEMFLLDEFGSEQKNLWGINLYPENYGGDGWLEFDSMINLRPSDGNRSRGVEDKNIQKIIINIVDKLVIK